MPHAATQFSQIKSSMNKTNTGGVDWTFHKLTYAKTNNYWLIPSSNLWQPLSMQQIQQSQRTTESV